MQNKCICETFDSRMILFVFWLSLPFSLHHHLRWWYTVLQTRNIAILLNFLWIFKLPFEFLFSFLCSIAFLFEEWWMVRILEVGLFQFALILNLVFLVLQLYQGSSISIIISIQSEVSGWLFSIFQVQYANCFSLMLVPEFRRDHLSPLKSIFDLCLIWVLFLIPHLDILLFNWDLRWLHHNQLSGAIPSELGAVTSLMYMYVAQR